MFWLSKFAVLLCYSKDGSKMPTISIYAGKVATNSYTAGFTVIKGYFYVVFLVIFFLVTAAESLRPGLN